MQNVTAPSVLIPMRPGGAAGGGQLALVEELRLEEFLLTDPDLVSGKGIIMPTTYLAIATRKGGNWTAPVDRALRKVRHPLCCFRAAPPPALAASMTGDGLDVWLQTQEDNCRLTIELSDERGTGRISFWEGGRTHASVGEGRNTSSERRSTRVSRLG